MDGISMSTDNYRLTDVANAQNANSVKKAPPADEQEKNAIVQREATSTSAPMSLPDGGTITYSKDGDTFENKSSGSETVSAATSGTVSSTSASTDPEETDSTDNDKSNSSSEANNMILQGYSDSKIKEKTGVSQQEIDKLRNAAKSNSNELEPSTEVEF